MIKATAVLVAALLFCISSSEGKKLSAYITPCKKNDPNLNKCAKEQATKALPYIMKGDRRFKTPILQPLHLDLIDIHPSDTLSIKLTNMSLMGLETAVIEDVDFDLKKQHISTRQSFSRINILCTYNMEGRILVLPISGTGPANMTFDDLVVDYTFDYKLIKKDGKDFIDTNIKPVVKFSAKKAYYHFDNLFNGDKTLGDHMNKFLNENQKEVTQDLGTAVSETIGAIVTSILKSFVSSVAYEDIFVS